MSFIVSDGTNYETANSFCSLEYADAYHSLRNNSLWTGSDAEKQAALIKATDYIEQNYGSRFIGYPIQGSLLSWPRFNVSLVNNTIFIPANTIPDVLLKAVCELALSAIQGQLNPDIVQGPQVKRQKVDVLEIEYTDTPVSTTIRPSVTGYLRGLLGSSGINVSVVRA
jgi:hypothetical protein